MMPKLRILMFVLLMSQAAVADGKRTVEVERLPSLPSPVSNNAAALAVTDDGPVLYSFFGLGAGKTWRDLDKRFWTLAPGSGEWQRLNASFDGAGRLAGAAVTAGDSVWLFGGYTVAEDGTEVSTPEVFRLHAASGQMTHAGDMPVPVDDMAVLAFRDRFIYLVSGWHDLGNVNLVQVLDTSTMKWSQATPYPGSPVFGHAGAMSGDTMLVCDGVRIEYGEAGAARRFVPADECWLGRVDGADHRRIGWQRVAAHPGRPRYRMGAAADCGRIVFAGGSANPYNYDGIGYDGVPSEPESAVFSFDLQSGVWESRWTWPEASMDHRNLLFHDGWFYLAGGMLRGRQVSDRVLRFRLQ